MTRFRTCKMLLLILLALLGLFPRPCHAGTGKVKDGVIDISARIQDTVPYNKAYLEAVKKCIIDGSSYLHGATNSQNRFGKVIIVIPSKWSDVVAPAPPAEMKDSNYDLLIPNNEEGSANVDALGGTGAMTVGILDMIKATDTTSARTLVHEFGHYGYGLYDEYMRTVVKNGAQYMAFKQQGKWLKCTDKVTWEVTPEEVGWEEKYYAVAGPSSPSTNSASIMWYQQDKNITAFCDTNHNSSCNTDQQAIHGESCWATMAANKKFSLALPGSASVVKITNDAPTFTIYREGKGARENLGFYLVSGTDRSLYDYPQPVRITATLFRDDLPVCGARVIATITTPGGSTIEFPLGDRGNRGDSFPADGTYEGLFVDFRGDGSYQVSIKADNPTHDARAGVGFPDPPPLGTTRQVKTRDVITDDFLCEAPLPPFTVSGVVEKDLIPPGQIDEFDGTVLADGSMVLTWLAPGNNSYEGRAQSYELKYADTPIVSDDDWNKATPLKDLPVPGECDTQETMTTPSFPTGIYYLALRAADGTGLVSEPAWLTMEVAGLAADQNVLNPPGDQGGSTFCFIATATYGTPLAPQVRVLRTFRDRILMASRPGQLLVKAYYTFSPPFARAVASSPLLRLGAYHVLSPVIVVLAWPWLCLALAAGAIAGVLGWRRCRKGAA